MKPIPLIITGMHRSGTSLLAQIVGSMGVKTPNLEQIGANSFNERGYYELKAVQELNDRVLSFYNSSWSNPFEILNSDVKPEVGRKAQIELMEIMNATSSEQTIYIKDPRFCLTYPHFDDVFSKAVFIVAFRNPPAVARSLKTRDNLPTYLGQALWELYLHRLIQNLSFERVCFVEYERVLRDESGVRKSLAGFLLKNNVEIDDQAKVSIVDPSLNHAAQHSDNCLESLSGTEKLHELLKTFDRSPRRSWKKLRSLEFSENSKEILQRHAKYCEISQIVANRSRDHERITDEMQKQFVSGFSELRKLIETQAFCGLASRQSQNQEASHIVDELPTNDPPIFIVGAPLSGQDNLTLVLREGLGYNGYSEGHVMPLLGRLLNQIDIYFDSNAALIGNPDHLLTYIPRQVFSDFVVMEFCRLFLYSQKSNRWFDKTGNAENILLTPKLIKWFSGARIFFCKQSGIENVHARIQHFPDVSFESHCGDWSECMEAWLKVREDVGARGFEIDQTACLSKSEDLCDELSHFLGVNDDRRTDIQNVLNTISSNQNPLKYQTQKHSLDNIGWTHEEKDIFKARCTAAMESYGYVFEEKSQ